MFKMRIPLRILIASWSMDHGRGVSRIPQRDTA
jgi:hypothetical protein